MTNKEQGNRRKSWIIPIYKLEYYFYTTNIFILFYFIIFFIYYPNRAANGQPSRDEIAVVNIANSYFLAYHAAMAAVLQYLEKKKQNSSELWQFDGKTATFLYFLVFSYFIWLNCNIS